MNEDSDQSEKRVSQPLAEWRFEDGDVVRGMGGDYWIIAERLWNFDAREVEYADYYGPAYEVTTDRDRREYVLSKLDPHVLGGEKMRLSENDLVSHFDDDATAEEAREHYRNNDGELKA